MVPSNTKYHVKPCFNILGILVVENYGSDIDPNAETAAGGVL